jgi:hypothetical protein
LVIEFDTLICKFDDEKASEQQKRLPDAI